MKNKTLFALLLSLIIFYSSRNVVFAGSVTDGLISYWQFNGDATESATDSHGTNDGSFVNGATNPFTQNNFQQSLYVDGNSQYFSVPDSPDLDFTSAMTIIAWVKPMDLSSYNCIIAKWLVGGGVNRAWGLVANEDLLELNINTTSGALARNTSIPVLVQDQWQQIAMTYSATDQQLTAYRINESGMYSESFAIQGDIRVGTAPVTFGGLPTVLFWYHGYIDEVKIYNRALDPSEIMQEYNYVMYELNNTQIIPEPLSIFLTGSGIIFIFLRKRNNF